MVVISGRLRLRIDFGQSQFLSVGYLFRCELTEGLYNRGYSGHEEGNFLLGANSTAGRPCRRRLRIGGKIYLVVPLGSLQ